MVSAWWVGYNAPQRPHKGGLVYKDWSNIVGMSVFRTCHWYMSKRPSRGAHASASVRGLRPVGRSRSAPPPPRTRRHLLVPPSPTTPGIAEQLGVSLKETSGKGPIALKTRKKQTRLGSCITHITHKPMGASRRDICTDGIGAQWAGVGMRAGGLTSRRL